MPAGDGRLVCQHLENVARDLLQDYPDIIRSLARGRHGIYALYRGDRLYYLGLAARMRGLAESTGMTLAKLLGDMLLVYATEMDSGYQPGTRLGRWDERRS